MVMKQKFFLLIISIVMTASLTAQTEKFNMASFVPPQGSPDVAIKTPNT
jgi:hypothetical protein